LIILPKTVTFSLVLDQKWQCVHCDKIKIMSDHPAPRIRSVLPFSFLLAVPGWAVLIYLMTSTKPNLGNRWLFFAAVIFAAAGTSAPVIGLFNRILRPVAPAFFETIIRESLMVGVLAAVLLWLNKGQVLTIGLAIILGVGFFLVEFFMRLRSRAEWRPGQE
jgi:hypothetical protein